MKERCGWISLYGKLEEGDEESEENKKLDQLIKKQLNSMDEEDE